MVYFTEGRGVWLCIMSIILQLGWGGHHIGLRLGLRIGKLETGLKHIVYGICVEQFFSGFFLFIEKLLKETDALYMKNKYQDPIAPTLSILFRVSQKGNAKCYALVSDSTQHQKAETDIDFLNSYINNRLEQTYMYYI